MRRKRKLYLLSCLIFVLIFSVACSNNAKISSEEVKEEVNKKVEKKSDTSKKTVVPVGTASEKDSALMPLPMDMALDGGKLIINNIMTYHIDTSSDVDQKIIKALERMSERSEVSIDSGTDGQAMLKITYDKISANFPQLGEDESYSLTISDSAIQLKASTSLGIIRGLTTLTQMVERDNEGTYIATGEIKDAPRYPWRGILVDVSRRFLHKEIILRNLDAMETVKLNVLHLHLANDQGIRIESKEYPRLHEVGSNGDYYTQEEIKEIVDYAADRGIRVMPEFDIPKHSTALAAAYPDITTGESTGPATWYFQEPYEAVDPSLDETYEFFDGLFAEMATLFPDEYVHIGGDETSGDALRSWEDTQHIKQFMVDNGINGTSELATYFNNRISELLNKHGKKMAGMHEILREGLENSPLIQDWLGPYHNIKAANEGLKSLSSTDFFLDWGRTAGYHYLKDPSKPLITLEPDPEWYAWELTIGPTVATLLIYSPHDNPRGIFNVNGMYLPLSNLQITESSISMMINDFRPYAGEFDENMNIVSEIPGVLIGSHTLPDTEAPKVNFYYDSPEAATNMVGSEACAWTELWTPVTFDSRVWPVTAAIAERFWSPWESTQDVEDMYKRLDIVTLELEKVGVKHRDYRAPIVKSIAGDMDTMPFENLIDVLCLGEGSFRLADVNTGDFILMTDTPLEYVHDATNPESILARKFKLQINALKEDASNETLLNEIKGYLELWYKNHEALLPMFEVSERAAEVKKHSENLARLSELALKSLEAHINGKRIEDIDRAAVEAMIEEASMVYGYTHLAVVDSLVELINLND